MGAEPILEDSRRDVLAARRDDDFLLATGDRQEAIVVEFSDVTRMEPAVANCLVRGLRVVPIATKHVTSPDQDLPVVGDAQRHSRNRQSDRTDRDGIWPVHRGAGGGLGETVTLQHRDPYAAVEVAKP